MKKIFSKTFQNVVYNREKISYNMGQKPERYVLKCAHNFPPYHKESSFESFKGAFCFSFKSRNYSPVITFTASVFFGGLAMRASEPSASARRTA